MSRLISNDPVHSETLNKFYAKIDAMSSEEKSKHLGEDYRPTAESHIYPEYLDFIDEWEYNRKDVITRLKIDFIYSVLGQRNMRIDCRDHYHIFKAVNERERYSNERETESVPMHAREYIYVSTDMTLPQSACWYQTVNGAINSTNEMTYTGSVSLPRCLQSFIERMSQIRMYQKGFPPIKLSFSMFRKMWWDLTDLSDRDKAHRILAEHFSLNESHADACITNTIQLKQNYEPVSVSDEEKFRSKDANIQGAFWGSKVQIMLRTRTVLWDHGLHVLLSAVQDPVFLVRFLNEVRLQGGSTEEINMQNIAFAIGDCPLCRDMEIRDRCTSPFAIYYAPPGNGKSTALRHESFIGFDTDWTHSGVTYEDFIPLFKQEIPIITNMYTLGMNSGIKEFGYFNSGHLRHIEETSRAFTSPDEIHLFQKLAGRDFTCYYEQIPSRHLSSGILVLYFLSYVNAMVLDNYFCHYSTLKPMSTIRTNGKAVAESIAGIKLNMRQYRKHRKRDKK